MPKAKKRLHCRRDKAGVLPAKQNAQPPDDGPRHRQPARIGQDHAGFLTSAQGARMGRVTMLRPDVQMAGQRIRAVNLPPIGATPRTYGRTWMSIRDGILTRDMGQCQECLRAGYPNPGWIIDHITPLWAGGLDSPENLQTLCQPCHDTKTADETRQRKSL